MHFFPRFLWTKDEKLKQNTRINNSFLCRRGKTVCRIADKRNCTFEFHRKKNFVENKLKIACDSLMCGCLCQGIPIFFLQTHHIRIANNNRSADKKTKLSRTHIETFDWRNETRKLIWNGMCADKRELYTETVWKQSNVYRRELCQCDTHSIWYLWCCLHFAFSFFAAFFSAASSQHVFITFSFMPFIRVRAPYMLTVLPLRLLYFFDSAMQSIRNYCYDYVVFLLDCALFVPDKFIARLK